MGVLGSILATVGLVALNGYFVATEFCAVTARRSWLESQAKKRLLARLALAVKSDVGLYLSATQLGVTLASLALGAVMEPAIGSLIRPLLDLLALSEHAQHITSYVISFAVGT